MSYTLPIGEIIKLMDRGVITLPSKYRKKLNIKRGEPLNVFEWEGILIVAPIKVTAKMKKEEMPGGIADWTTDTTEGYLSKTRYNPLEKLWAKRVREGW